MNVYFSNVLPVYERSLNVQTCTYAVILNTIFKEYTSLSSLSLSLQVSSETYTKHVRLVHIYLRSHILSNFKKYPYAYMYLYCSVYLQYKMNFDRFHKTARKVTNLFALCTKKLFWSWSVNLTWLNVTHMRLKKVSWKFWPLQGAACLFFICRRGCRMYRDESIFRGNAARLRLLGGKKDSCDVCDVNIDIKWRERSVQVGSIRKHQAEVKCLKLIRLRNAH